MSKEIREKDLTTMSGLRRRVVELEMENKKLRELVPQTVCRECRSSRCPDGIFLRCAKQHMRVVSPKGFCDEGRPRPYGKHERDSGLEKAAESSH